MMSFNQIFNGILSNKEMKQEIAKYNPNYKSYVTKNSYGQSQLLQFGKIVAHEIRNEISQRSSQS
tara:strand:+ start:227 stop:421 length:195 start_codon:yes stop_codon:yes gene_type:complete